MRLYFDLDYGYLTTDRGGSTPIRRLSFKAGDEQELELELFRSGVAFVPEVVEEMVFVIKPSYAAAAEVYAEVRTAGWEESSDSDAEAAVWTAILITDTEEIRTALGEAANIVVYAELTITADGIGPKSTSSLPCVLNNDLWKGDEGSPSATPQPDDEWVAHGHPQTLSDVQKAQARSNIGVPAADPNAVSVASPVDGDMIQRVGGSWVTRTLAQIKTALGLGSAAYTASTDYATAAQGTDARTPTAHKTSHATGGSDALTAADVGAAATSHTHDYTADITAGPLIRVAPVGVTNGSLASNVEGSGEPARNALGAGAVDLQNDRTASTQCASGTDSFIAGGQRNTASAFTAFAAGQANTASGDSSMVLGANSTASASIAIAIGNSCIASGQVSFASGQSSESTAIYSRAVGRRAKAIHQGANVESDSQNADVSSTTTDQKTFRFLNGYSFLGGAADFATRPTFSGSPLIESNPTGVTGADAITNIMSLTQAEYDAISPAANTLYVIV